MSDPTPEPAAPAPPATIHIRILSRYDQNACLFECDVAANEPQPMRVAVGKAVTSWAYLSGANLSGAYLSGAYLSGANLSRADLSGADLSWANLSGANLSGADLSRADLSGANLSGADLSRADLSGADLSRAYLSGAYLSGANLCGAKNANLAIAMTVITPAGALIGWKKCRGNVLVRLRIPEDARRSNATSRKCRSERAEVLEIVAKNEAGEWKPAEVAISHYDESVSYRVGQTVTCHAWDENRWNECSGGIHFLLTRAEAEAYQL